MSYPQPQPRYFQVKLTEHTGALILFSVRTITVTGTLEQCEAAYRRAQTHNLLAGWWSFLSVLLMNWIAIFGNMSQIITVRRLAAQPPAYPVAPPPAYPVAPPPPAAYPYPPSPYPPSQYPPAG